MKQMLLMTTLFLGATGHLELVAAAPSDDGLEAAFHTPPDDARPGVYWYFLDGNQDRDAMIAELHAMKDVGIGSVLFLEVDLGIPRGPVPFMSETWQDNVANTFVEAGRLGMEVALGTGPGWAGSGGSWLAVEDSMQHLVGASVKVNGPGEFDQALPLQMAHPANRFADMPRELAAQRENWFQDVAVLAFPSPAGDAQLIDDVAIKTLKDVRPTWGRPPKTSHVFSLADYIEPDASRVIDNTRVVDLTSRLQADGRLKWSVPAGEWTIMRFVARSTGQTTRPAPRSGLGFENNKFDGATYRKHWDHYQQKLLDRIIAKGGPLQPGKGLTTIHLDSWEMSSQNWTADFRQEFQKRRGYDPQPFYPAWMGLVVGSVEKTERFLWDMRKTSQELVLEQYAGEIKKVAHEHGLLYSNQPYDMNPAGDMDLGSVADIPMGEFWCGSFDTQYSCVEAVSIAHTMGRRVVKTESFTAGLLTDAYSKHPANMKNQTDWAFAMGINGIFFHTFEHQPLGQQARPGLSLQNFGIHWHRNQPFWNFLKPYHQYITRCSHLLRQGEAVADILYLAPEGAPHMFESPTDAFEGEPRLRDKRGYAFDAVTPRILNMRAVVEDGRIAFPDGSRYRVLVLPNLPTMTPETLACIERLVKAGATVIGNQPAKSPSLAGYPACDDTVSTLAKKMWGTADRGPTIVTRINYGKGAIYWGGEIDSSVNLYPSYTATAKLLGRQLGLPEDFSSPSGKLRFNHRRTGDHDIYFVSNRTEERVATEGIFRVDGQQPQLWDAVTGETRALGDCHSENGLTRVPLVFEPHQSFFVVFSRGSAGTKLPATPKPNVPVIHQLARLDGAWDVAFDPALGGPAKITFDSLCDWTQRPEEGIRYYSGTATYRKTFDVVGSNPAGDARVWLDLGVVHDICRVRLDGKELGTVWTAPWRVDITGMFRATGNQLEIEVANTWVNRLVGDQQPAHKNVRTLSWPAGLLGGEKHPAGRYTFVTHNRYDASSPLRPSGIVGPVTILTTTAQGTSR